MEKKDNYTRCDKIGNNNNNNSSSTLFYEEIKQNQNENLKNCEWKVNKNSKRKNKKKKYNTRLNYYNKLKIIKKKKKGNFKEIDKNNNYSLHDDKKKNNLEFIKNNLSFDNIIKKNQEKNKDNYIFNVSSLNNTEKNKSQCYLHNSVNSNYANNFNKYPRISRCYNKNNKCKYNENKIPNGNIRLTKELLDDLNKRNQENDADSDNQNFLIYVKKIIEEKKESKKKKNNNNNTKEISNAHLEFSNNMETYQTINDNNSLYSDESTKVFVNKKNKVKINMCENPCDMWYGLKTKNGKNIFINSLRNKNKKERKKKSKNIENYFINKKSKHSRWKSNYYMKLNNNDDNISVNTIATMHIDGNHKYNDKIENRNTKNDSYDNYNNNNFKNYRNKNIISNIQFDKTNKNDINNDKITKQTTKKRCKKNMTWSNKKNNNYVNTNNVHYVPTKNSSNNYYDNKATNFSNDIKSYDSKNKLGENNNICNSNLKLKKNNNENLSNAYTNNYSLSNEYNNIGSKENRSTNVIHHNNNEINDMIKIKNYRNNSSNMNCQSDNTSTYEKNMNTINNSKNNYYSNQFRSFNKINVIDYHLSNSTTKKNNVSNNSSLNKICCAMTNLDNNENNVKFSSGYYDMIDHNKAECYENNKINIDKINTYKNSIYPYNKNNLNNYSSNKVNKLNSNINLNSFLTNNKENDIKHHSHPMTVDNMSSIHYNTNYHCTKGKTNEYINNSYYHYINAKYNSKNFLGKNIIKKNKIFILNNYSFTGNKKSSEDSNKISDIAYDRKFEACGKISITNEVNNENDKISENIFFRKANEISKCNDSFNELIHLNYQNYNPNANLTYYKSYNANKINKDEHLSSIEGKDNVDFIDSLHVIDQNKKYKNYYYNNLNFDLSYELEDNKKNKKKKKNKSFSSKSIYKNARERVQSILAIRRGIVQ
ncbi:conserved Plasmodium protein, unknown function [Plasmodium relictum]|uniref:Uncharacterized protein n=1 Tax=Plasmodium relictum TaxID=85471 RepID=A0A1J1H6V8_PLARL|nr:conserved Plasmodium protein, unknown function [Plasmodium relictum]CRG99165.1 conserved Plasmodium protein, unknown function [Plasmodium relictum]